MNITATLLAQVAAFVLLIWMVNRLLWTPLITALENRRKQISEGLSAAEEGKESLAQAQTQAGKIENQARSKAAKIITNAEKRAAEIIDEAKSAAQQEAERIHHSAQTEIDRNIAQAKESLRAEVSTLAMLGAKQILRKEVDADIHSAALKELEDQL